MESRAHTRWIIWRWCCRSCWWPLCIGYRWRRWRLYSHTCRFQRPCWFEVHIRSYSSWTTRRIRQPHCHHWRHDTQCARHCTLVRHLQWSRCVGPLEPSKSLRMGSRIRKYSCCRTQSSHRSRLGRSSCVASNVECVVRSSRSSCGISQTASHRWCQHSIAAHGRSMEH